MPVPESQLDFFNGVYETEKEQKETRSKIEELVNVFTRPILAMPQYADMLIPNDVQNTITIERLILAKESQQIASEAEAMWYLSTASFVAPLSHEWYNVYMWLTRRYLIKINRTLPSFLDDEITLSTYTEENELRRLRAWLYRKSMEALKERRKYAEAQA